MGATRPNTTRTTRHRARTSEREKERERDLRRALVALTLGVANVEGMNHLDSLIKGEVDARRDLGDPPSRGLLEGCLRLGGRGVAPR